MRETCSGCSVSAELKKYLTDDELAGLTAGSSSAAQEETR
jgi:hypothetical protein